MAQINLKNAWMIYKIKVLKQKYNLNNTSDKIKFLNEIAKILADEDNTIEREVYIDKIAKTYQISREAILAEINKITNKTTKVIKKGANDYLSFSKS